MKMKNIVNHIKEGLKINSKTKIPNKFENYILEFLYSEPSDADPEEVKLINKWVKDTNIEYLTIVSTKNVLEHYGYTEEDGYSIDDLFDKYKNYNDVNIVLDDNLYETCWQNIGKSVYTTTYEREMYYINDNMLTCKFGSSRYIYFISDNKSHPIKSNINIKKP